MSFVSCLKKWNKKATLQDTVPPLLCWSSPLVIAALLVLFSKTFFHRGDYLSAQLCFHTGFCHPAQFLVAHILRVGWMENQITEIYRKLLNAQGASTDWEPFLPTATTQQWDVTYNFQISVGRHVHPLENLPGAWDTQREWSTWGRQTDGGCGLLLITSHHHMHIFHVWHTQIHQTGKKILFPFYVVCFCCHVVWCINTDVFLHQPKWHHKHTT